MPYYPVFLDLNDKKILVVGGGEVAERKIKTLLKYNCRIYITSKKFTNSLKRLVETESIINIPFDEIETHIKDAFMVIAATNDPHVNSQIATIGKTNGVLINAVDQPADCNFIVPSIVKRGDLNIAISTGGKSPALAKRIRKELESGFGEEYGTLVDMLGLIRKKILAMGTPQAQHKEIFEKLANAKLPELIRKNDQQGLNKTLSSILGKDFPLDEIMNS